MIVHIGGWPGVGKLTIGRLVASELGARLLDNHTLLNPAEALFERSNADYWALRRQIRSVVIGYAARCPPGTSIVFTDALGENVPSDVAMFEDVVRLSETRGVPLCAVLLDCSLEENARRLVGSDRRGLHKLTDTEMLSQVRNRYVLLRPAVKHRLDLEVTSLTAAESAARVVAFANSVARS